MNRSLLLRVTAPAVIVGLVLFAAAMTGVWYINGIQRNLANVLTGDMVSLEAAQSLEMAARRLRFNSILYLMDPKPARLRPIQDSERQFYEALAMARHSCDSTEDERIVNEIVSEYDKLQSDFAHLRALASSGQDVPDVHLLADQHTVNAIVDPCQTFLRINKDKMAKNADEARLAALRGNFAMVLLGLAGPASGLVMGYGVARGLRQSIYRLNVRVQDMAQHLGKNVVSMNVVGEGEFSNLDRRLQEVVHQVEQVAGRLQQQQRDLVRAEQLAAVGQLAAGVAHEVRNPLTGIKLLVEATHRTENPRPLDKEDLRVIEREIARVESTVQGLLDFARLPTPRFEYANLEDVIASAHDVIRARAAKQQVVVRLHPPDSPTIHRIDRDQIHTVLLNLMMNALDAMPGGGEMDIQWCRKPEGDVVLTVEDSGEGIADAIRDRLFTPFVTTKPTGTGLGLSLAARIAEEHDGVLTAFNRAGGGAQFSLRFNCADNGKKQ